MIGFVKNGLTWATKSSFQFDTYSVTLDYKHSSNSTITVDALPDVSKGDWVLGFEYEDWQQLVLWGGEELTDTDGNLLAANDAEPVIFGICKDVKLNNDNGYTITLQQPVTIFDRDVYYDYDKYKKRDIEGMLMQCINANWIQATDTYTRMTYMSVRRYSVTGLISDISISNGIFNPFDVMVQAFNEKNIIVRMVPTASKLYVDIFRDESVIKLSADLPDVVSYSEQDSDTRISRVDATWKLKDGNGYVGTLSYFSFYMLSNGSITTDASASGRITGTVKCKYITAETYADMLSKVQEEFDNGALEHKIELTVLQDGCYKMSDYYAGKTADVWIAGTEYGSYITSMSFDSTSNLLKLVFGDLPVTLSDKLKEAVS